MLYKPQWILACHNRKLNNKNKTRLERILSDRNWPAQGLYVLTLNPDVLIL